MNASLPFPRLGSLQTLLVLLLVVVSSGCGSLMQRTASLEDDELYLDRGEEFITDAEYLAYAFEQAGYNASGSDVDGYDARGGDGFQSSFGYVPQSLRGRSFLRGYMTPYGAAGFGPNPYDPWGSSFYGGYSPYSPGFYDPYNPYGSPMGNMGWGYNAWGVNPYMGNSWGYNPYGYGYGGYNPYAYAGTGFGGYGGYYGGMNNGWGTGWYDVSNVVVAPRTPIWTSSAINSNGTGGRLLTNKVDVDTESGSTPSAGARTIWRGIDSGDSGTSRTTPSSTSPSNSTRNSRSTWSSSTQPSNQTRSTTSSSRTNSTRNTNWSGSSSGSSGSSRSTTQPSNSPNRGSSGSSTGRSTGGSRGNSGRGGGQPTP